MARSSSRYMGLLARDKARLTPSIAEAATKGNTTVTVHYGAMRVIFQDNDYTVGSAFGAVSTAVVSLNELNYNYL